jgi:hypothetical protein
MFATLRYCSSAEVFHMTHFSQITHKWLPLYLANDSVSNTNTNTNENNKILELYLANHVNEMWKKYL